MAKKKRKSNRPRAGAPAGQGGANEARRERKEEARAAREAERKRAARASAVRRALIFSGVAVLLVGLITFIGRAASSKPLSAAAKAAAQEAGCGDLQRPAASAPGGVHLSSGETHTYDDPPATSGPHDPTPLPLTPRVYTEPVLETQAVHTLEHGGVIVYYRLPGEGGVAQPVVDALGPVVSSSRASYLIPYPGLPDGQGMAFTAWNQRMFCPAGITVAEASAIARGFIDSFACTSNAPEGKQGDGC